MLLTTEQAAAATGLSAHELRIGFKQGRYPAIEVGRGERRRALRWSLERLQASIDAAMSENMQNNQER